MCYSLLLSLFIVVVLPALGMEPDCSIRITAKGDKNVRIPLVCLTQEVAQLLQNKDICQWFKNISPELIQTLVRFCNFIRMESKVDTQSGMKKFVILNISFEDMPEFLRVLVILSLHQKVITEAIRYYVEKAEKRKIYLNNYQFHTDAEKDSSIKLEIAKWYFLKYGSHLDIPQGSFPSISIHDLLEAEKKITATTVSKMVGKLAQIDTYCQLDDIVIMLNNFRLTSLDGMNELLIQLKVSKEKIGAIDLRGHYTNKNLIKLSINSLDSADYKALKVLYLDNESVFLPGKVSAPIVSSAWQPVVDKEPVIIKMQPAHSVIN